MKFICPLIVVKDMNRARHFYEDILQQVVKYDFGENIQFEGNFSIHLENHFHALIDSVGNEVIQHKSNNFELYFESEDIVESEYKLKLAKVEFIHELTEQPWGQRVVRVYDYDGHIIEIGESLETVVSRYLEAGWDIEKISKKTSMPVEFIMNVKRDKDKND